MAGVFVTFEGGEGSGKSTQMRRLEARLTSSGVPCLVTREPGGTPLGESLRSLALDTSPPPAAMTEALMIVAARAELVAAVLRPALEDGRVVLCDRYADSTLAYQGGGRGLDGTLLDTLNRAATGGLVPDLTLLFDLDPERGLARRAGGGPTNRLDRESVEFHRRVRTRYLELAKAEPERILVLDAAAPEADLEEEVWRAVAARLPLVRR
jgi:dTMP kinase